MNRNTAKNLLFATLVMGTTLFISSVAAAKKVLKNTKLQNPKLEINSINYYIALPIATAQNSNNNITQTPIPALSNTNYLIPINEGDSLIETDLISQVTSVSQLSDVQPTDWAFQALPSLVERYGVIAGYSDSSRGNQVISRYEFAAALNAALERINELIAAGSSDRITQADLATLRKLQAQFATELIALRGRIDVLEAVQRSWKPTNSPQLLN